jgi:hypothetical protein
MSIANAARWATVINHINEPAIFSGNSEHDPPRTR